MNIQTHKTSNRPIRVLLIAKYPLLQEGMKLLIESDKDLIVTATRSITDSFGGSAKVPDSDVALICLANGDRVEIISSLLRQSPGLRVVVLVEAADLDSQAAALKLGAVGIVYKEQNPPLLIAAIKQTYNGETWLNQILLRKLLDKGKSSGKNVQKLSYQRDIESLTARELEVIQLIGEGLKNKIIAERLHISEATVRHHLSSVYGKVGVDDRLNLVIFAFQRGLLKLSKVEDNPV